MVNAILGAIGAACAGSIAYFAAQPGMWRGDPVANWWEVLSRMAFVLVPAIYFHQMHRREVEKQQKEAEERTSAARSLYQNLLYIYRALEGRSHPEDLMKLKFDKMIVVFLNRTLNPDAYDSIINGGNIHLIKEELRVAIAEIYSLVRSHNYYILHAHQMIDWAHPEKTSEAAFHYFKMLEIREVVLRREIPKMMQKLRELEPSLRN